jgi:glycosyltransferase involved in cell wall biosynthesis
VRSDFHNKFNKLKCCVIVPTYNNEFTLAGVLDRVRGYTQNIIVINDGSTYETRSILNNYKDIEIINLNKNKGKGNALRTGFMVAREKGYEYAITIDSDGQHNADDLPLFINAIEKEAGALIVGARNMNQDGIPGKSSFGHKFSNFWYTIETGINLPDTQSGYRLYPIKELSNMRFYTQKFEFEIEVLVRAAWNVIPIRSVPVCVYYSPKAERVSHFRPLNDFLRISLLNTLLVILALLFFRPYIYFRSFSLDKLKQLVGSGEPAFKLSLAVGFGIFMGIIPIWGYQMIVAAFLAHLMKLNKPLVLIASNISIPPLIAFIIYGSFVMGQVFVKTPVNLTFDHGIDLMVIKTGLTQYISGSILLAVSAGFITALGTYIFLTIRRSR